MARRWRTVMVVTAAALAAAACGGSGDAASSTSSPATTVDVAAATSSPPSTGPISSAPSTSTTAAASPAPSTSTSGTAPAPAPSTTVAAATLLLDLDVVRSMLDDVGAAMSGPDPTPLEIAARVIGFPVAVAVPDGSRLHRMEVDGRRSEGVARWRWLYEAFAPGDVGDIDITLDDQGPGSVALAERYDPLMAELGFRRNGTTGSDPGDPGGPNSVNHVYPPLGEVRIAGAVADVPNVKVWASEDLLFPEDTLEPGYRVDLAASLGAIVEPVPLLAAIRSSFAVPADARPLADRLVLRTRPEDSFDAAYGLHYLDVTVSWTTGEAVEQVVDGYRANPLGDPWAAAEPSFFEPGTYEPSEPRPGSGDQWLMDVLLGRTHVGELVIVAGEEGTTIELDLRLEPGRQVLEPPT